MKGVVEEGKRKRQDEKEGREGAIRPRAIAP